MPTSRRAGSTRLPCSPRGGLRASPDARFRLAPEGALAGLKGHGATVQAVDGPAETERLSRLRSAQRYSKYARAPCQYAAGQRIPTRLLGAHRRAVLAHLQPTVFQSWTRRREEFSDAWHLADKQLSINAF